MNHEEMNQYISHLETETAELNKKLSVLVTPEDKNAAIGRKRRFTMIASKLLTGPLRRFYRKSFYRPHYQKKRGLVCGLRSAGKEGRKSYFIASAPDKDQKSRRPFMVYSEEGEFVIYENGNLSGHSIQWCWQRCCGAGVSSS